ncbi:hypothetical protein BC628DRAFT_664823 [Trametes gibbosa]|nr:hypothetical protein BC628DRAFT_664823 [Trametes gibbosa]
MSEHGAPPTASSPDRRPNTSSLCLAYSSDHPILEHHRQKDNTGLIYTASPRRGRGVERHHTHYTSEPCTWYRYNHTHTKFESDVQMRTWETHVVGQRVRIKEERIEREACPSIRIHSYFIHFVRAPGVHRHSRSREGVSNRSQTTCNGQAASRIRACMGLRRRPKSCKRIVSCGWEALMALSVPGA